MKQSATEHAAEDKKKKEAVEIKNQADTLVFQTKKQMEELKDKLTADMHNRLETEIRKVEDALAANDTDKIKSATEGLTKVWNEIAPTLYQQGPQPGTDGPHLGKSGPVGQRNYRVHPPFCYWNSPCLMYRKRSVPCPSIPIST